MRLAKRALVAGLTPLFAACGLVSPEPVKVQEVTLAAGDLVAVVRDNSQSPQVLSGIDSLFHEAAPGFDAFDPDTSNPSAGLHFEHIISGYRDRANRSEPRRGRMRLFAIPGGTEAVLVREAGDSAWRIASELRYQLVAPHYIDIDFRCQATQLEPFGDRGYAVFYFASDMNDVVEPHIAFPGHSQSAAEAGWVRVDAPEGPTGWDGGGTYRGAGARDLEHDADHNASANLWAYDDPRITEPFYFGRLAHGMVWAVLFDRLITSQDEIRFSLFKSKLPQLLRPAWDFQYVIHRVQLGRTYGFRARAIFKPFAGEDDIRAEYQRWIAERKRGKDQASSR
jgi:hypothetical protein